jgi:hypothetical protein
VISSIIAKLEMAKKKSFANVNPICYGKKLPFDLTLVYVYYVTYVTIKHKACQRAFKWQTFSYGKWEKQFFAILTLP